VFFEDFINTTFIEKTCNFREQENCLLADRLALEKIVEMSDEEKAKRADEAYDAIPKIKTRLLACYRRKGGEKTIECKMLEHDLEVARRNMRMLIVELRERERQVQEKKDMMIKWKRIGDDVLAVAENVKMGTENGKATSSEEL
jgi:hypothetical protein